MSQLALQGQEVHSQQALRQFDAVLDSAIALGLMKLRLFLEDFDVELVEHQRPQRENRALVVRLQDHFVPESEAADSFCGTLRGCSFIEKGTPAGHDPGLDCPTLALFQH